MLSFDSFLHTTPRVQYFPDYETTGESDGISLAGIQVLCFDGADYQGKHTKVFAHIGFPENTGKKVPAVVLVHGGGGHPEDLWIKKWNEQGFAAIAMDTTGFFPTQKIPHLYEGFERGLKRELCPPFAEDGYTVGPDNSGMADLLLPLEEQWMYHAVSAVILAHNILRGDTRIDSTKIGISGISWGGIITSTVIGHDPRFAFAVPIYGAGFLKDGDSLISAAYKEDNAALWRAEARFDRVKIPVLWLCWNDDCFFPAQANSKSFLATKVNNKNTCLSLKHEMFHSHREGFTPGEGYWFAHKVINGEAVPEVQAEYKNGKVHYTCTEKAAKVRLFYINEKMSHCERKKYNRINIFMQQDWQIKNLDPTQNTAALPADAYGCYVEFTLQNGMVLTTPYTEQQAVPIQILLLPKFENGEMTGDFPGEAQFFYEHYCKGGAQYTVDGGFPGHKLYVKDGIALYVTGCAKINAVLGLTAVLHDRRFDFSDTFFLSVGCAGSAVGSTVMGDVFVITAAADFDLGHHADARDLAPDTETTWFHNPVYDSAAFRILDKTLTDKVYKLVKDTPLRTTEKTRAFMQKQFGKAAWASRSPAVLKGTTLSGDNYWKGLHDHRNAEKMVQSYCLPDPFVCAEMEDAALAVALDRYGLLDRFIALRVSVNMDVFTSGLTPESLWGTQSGAAFDSDDDREALDIFPAAMENLFCVGKKVIDALLIKN